MSALRSLKHEYELFVEREIEQYKDTISRTALLAIGDEAVVRLRAHAQTALTEMLLWEEVDRIIALRLDLPTYRSWRPKYLKRLAELRRPEHWGLSPKSALAREISAQAAGAHVLIAGAADECATMYSAAHGCEVTALGAEPECIERLMDAAASVGLAGNVRGCVGDLGLWAPDVALRLVVCTPDAFAGLSEAESADGMEALRRATLAGGVHLVQALAAGPAGLTLDAMRGWYAGWHVSLDGEGSAATLLARKSAA